MWSFRGAHPRTQVHHPLGVAWHCCSKVRDGKQGLCMLPKRSFILGYRQITIESDHSGQYTTHIGIENRYSLGETKCGNRSCGGATDSRQLRQEFSGRRENPAVLSNNQLRAPMQISGTTVITQAAPEAQHLVLRSAGKCAHIRESFQKTCVVTQHGAHLGLLQHDFRQPNPVGVAGLLPGEMTASMTRLPPHNPSGYGLQRLAHANRKSTGVSFWEDSCSGSSINCEVSSCNRCSS